MDWANNCWHQALARIDLPDEFKGLTTSMAVARRIKQHGSIEEAMSSLPYLQSVDVLKARIGDLMVFRWSPRLLDFTMAVNLDGLVSIGPSDYYQSHFKTLDAHAAFRPCHKE
jgi:hypothetical protein